MISASSSAKESASKSAGVSWPSSCRAVVYFAATSSVRPIATRCAVIAATGMDDGAVAGDATAVKSDATAVIS